MKAYQPITDLFDCIEKNDFETFKTLFKINNHKRSENDKFEECLGNRLLGYNIYIKNVEKYINYCLDNNLISYLDKNTINFMSITPLHGTTNEFNNSDFEPILKFGFETLYIDSDSKEKADSGDYSKVIYGKCTIGEMTVFFYTKYDPGRSGYGCCGFAYLRYTNNIESFKKSIDNEHYNEVLKRL